MASYNCITCVSIYVVYSTSNQFIFLRIFSTFSISVLLRLPFLLFIPDTLHVASSWEGGLDGGMNEEIHYRTIHKRLSLQLRAKNSCSSPRTTLNENYSHEDCRIASATNSHDTWKNEKKRIKELQNNKKKTLLSAWSTKNWTRTHTHTPLALGPQTLKTARCLMFVPESAE